MMDLSEVSLPNACPVATGGESDTTESKCRIVLERLKEGPLSCVTVDHLVHRGQAIVGKLRQFGHDIVTEQVGGVDTYVWYGFDRKVKVSLNMLAAYYDSRHWRLTAASRRLLDGCCVLCGANDQLEVHHWRYSLFAEDVDRDLATLCRDCHQNVHESAAGSRNMHFPRYVSVEIAKKLGWSE